MPSSSARSPSWGGGTKGVTSSATPTSSTTLQGLVAAQGSMGCGAMRAWNWQRMRSFSQEEADFGLGRGGSGVGAARRDATRAMHTMRSNTTTATPTSIGAIENASSSRGKLGSGLGGADGDGGGCTGGGKGGTNTVGAVTVTPIEGIRAASSVFSVPVSKRSATELTPASPSTVTVTAIARPTSSLLATVTLLPPLRSPRACSIMSPMGVERFALAAKLYVRSTASVTSSPCARTRARRRPRAIVTVQVALAMPVHTAASVD
mmetsp:Transcript_37682/g.99583  ORF Transcript_37682/g.99583 Transcript_37682/m.99583 type:complete len:263 (+) Transcript_37682:893-1681(+)